MTVIYTRKEVEEGTAIEALAPLLPLISCDQTVIEGKGRLSIVILGYDEENRTIGEIVELRKWFGLLTEQFPYWAHFCKRNDEMRCFVLSLLCGIFVERRISVDMVHVTIDPWQEMEVVERLIGQSLLLYREVGITKKESRRFEREMRDWFQ